MSAFVQNVKQKYKLWRQACRDLKTANVELNNFQQSIQQQVSMVEFEENATKIDRFYASLPKDETQPDFQEKLNLALVSGAKIYRAQSCFLVASELVYTTTPTNDTDNVFLVTKQGRCVNNLEDDKFDKSRCEGCQHISDIEKNHMLIDKVRVAKQKKKDTRKQFFSCIVNWQTKGL